jgi:hypothetical protein
MQSNSNLKILFYIFALLVLCGNFAVSTTEFSRMLNTHTEEKIYYEDNQRIIYNRYGEFNIEFTIVFINVVGNLILTYYFTKCLITEGDNQK